MVDGLFSFFNLSGLLGAFCSMNVFSAPIDLSRSVIRCPSSFKAESVKGESGLSNLAVKDISSITSFGISIFFGTDLSSCYILAFKAPFTRLINFWF